MSVFKRYLLALLAGFLSAVVLSFLILFPVWWLFLALVLFWLAISVFLYFQLYKGSEGFLYDSILLVVSQFSFIGLILLVEWDFLRWLLLVLCTVFVILLFLKLHKNNNGLAYQQKPIRRMKMMLWVFDVYAICTTVFAVSIFFSRIYFGLLAVLAGLVTAGISIMIWKMYFPTQDKKLYLWSALVGLVMMEIIWVLHLLPLGYLVLGLLVTWVWFILQVFIRFHLSLKDIIWRKQIPFLLVNLVLFFVILFFIVRWI
jgi:hypothetical protein